MKQAAKNAARNQPCSALSISKNFQNFPIMRELRSLYSERRLSYVRTAGVSI